MTNWSPLSVDQVDQVMRAPLFGLLLFLAGCAAPLTNPQQGGSIIQPAGDPAGVARSANPGTTNVLVVWSPVTFPTNWNTIALNSYILRWGAQSMVWTNVLVIPPSSTNFPLTLYTSLTNYLAISAVVEVISYTPGIGISTNLVEGDLSSELTIYPSYWAQRKAPIKQLPAGSTAQ